MSISRKKKSPTRVFALPDLEQAKSAVLNTLTSVSGQRTYDHAINDSVEWYCSEPRLAFNRTVVLRYRIYLKPHWPQTREVDGAERTNFPKNHSYFSGSPLTSRESFTVTRLPSSVRIRAPAKVQPSANWIVPAVLASISRF